MRVFVALGVSTLAGLVGCSDKPKAPAPPPAVVEVETVQTKDVPHIVELPGRIASVRTAEVRARTDGIVLRRLYEEGQAVKEGAPLFQLDPRDYAAQVEQSQATLARYEATRTNAQAIVNRYEPLSDRRAVSAQELDAAKSDLAQAQAQVAEARAALTRSKLQLEYTTVRSPIAGIAGQAEVTEGALVSGSQSTLMTRVDQTSPVYANFSVSSTMVLDATRDIQSGAVSLPSLSKVAVTLVLENGQEYDAQGTLDFTSSVVDPTTGSQVVRAHFDNNNRLLKPGQFVTGRIHSGTAANGIVIPTRAVQMKGQQASVSLLSKDEVVLSRPITLGAMTEQGWIVKSGLIKGDRLIVDGWQKARVGQKAKARPEKTLGSASTTKPHHTDAP